MMKGLRGLILFTKVNDNKFLRGIFTVQLL